MFKRVATLTIVLMRVITWNAIGDNYNSCTPIVVVK